MAVTGEFASPVTAESVVVPGDPEAEDAAGGGVEARVQYRGHGGRCAPDLVVAAQWGGGAGQQNLRTGQREDQGHDDVLHQRLLA